MIRTVTLPSGQAVTLSAYVRAWNLIRAAAPEVLFTGFDSFDQRRPMAAGQIRRRMLAGLHERISEAIPYTLRGLACSVPPRGRKYSSDWQRAARHCAREVNTQRLIVRWVTRDFRERLAHRITEVEL